MNIKPRALIGAVIYIIVFAIASTFGQWVFAIAFTLLWIDKLILSVYKIKNDMGLELLTLSSALIGVEFGTVGGFITTLIILPILDVLKWFLTYPTSSGEPPFYLRLESIIYPLLAVVASYLSSVVSPILAVLLTVILRELFAIFGGIITKDYSVFVVRGLNFIFVILLLYAISSVLALI